jgi:hypothetical protein
MVGISPAKTTLTHININVNSSRTKDITGIDCYAPASPTIAILRSVILLSRFIQTNMSAGVSPLTCSSTLPILMADLQKIPADMVGGSTKTLNLLDLPGEIRNHIYALLFNQPFRVVIGEKSLIRNLDDTPQSSQLIETCRQIHNKAVPRLFRFLTLVATECTKRSNLDKLVNFTQASHVKEMVIHLRYDLPFDFWFMPKFANLECCFIATNYQPHEISPDQFEYLSIQTILERRSTDVPFATTIADIQLDICFGTEQRKRVKSTLEFSTFPIYAQTLRSPLWT